MNIEDRLYSVRSLLGLHKVLRPPPPSKTMILKFHYSQKAQSQFEI
jgi:hypothetical protein